MNKKREKRLNILCGIFAGVFLVILTGQALLRVSSGDFIGGKNYYGQPVGPILQLIGVLVCLIVLSVVAWRHWHGRGKHSKTSDGRRPDWMREPPHKFPWE